MKMWVFPGPQAAKPLQAQAGAMESQSAKLYTFWQENWSAALTKVTLPDGGSCRSCPAARFWN